ncbi:MAG: helix-turn-helix transcriptional regulator [Thermincolia bacterium]
MQRIDIDKIKKLRIEKNILQSEMAEHLGYKTPIGYHYLEKGRCHIKAEQLVIIASKLGVSLEELYVSKETLYDQNTTDTVAEKQTLR